MTKKTMHTPDKSIADTGERMVPAYHKTHMVYGEHIVRYRAAQEIVKGLTILDIASGSGYGSALLGETASEVYGVDVSDDAIDYATKNYSSKNVSFIKGDGTKIPLKDNQVDIVVSFETIEHIEDYKTFMKEVKRVLKPEGLFILSTPNEIEFPESNHFHIHEFEEKELSDLAKEFFKYKKSYYQATWLYNGLFPASLTTTEWEKSIPTMQTAPIDNKKCIYFYMLLSNREISEEVEPLAAISEHWSERSIQEYENSVREHIEEQGKIIKHLENTINNNDQQIQQYSHRLDSLKNSFFGKIFLFIKRKLK